MPAFPPVTKMTLFVKDGMEVLGLKLWGFGSKLRPDLMKSIETGEYQKRTVQAGMGAKGKALAVVDWEKRAMYLVDIPPMPTTEPRKAVGLHSLLSFSHNHVDA